MRKTPRPGLFFDVLSSIRMPGISWCKRKNVPRSRSCFWTGARRGRLSAPLRHALNALCLYCVTGDEPSPDLLTRLLESNRKFIRIPLPQAIARRVRDREATGSAGPSSAAQLPHLAQIPLTLDGI